ncbi:MAG: hypothetical protein Q9178_003100 [Gyalolechia marmorata]
MAAIDPTAEPEHTGTANGETPARATLKLIYDRSSQVDDDDGSEGSSDEQYLKALLEGQESDEGDEDEDEDDDDDEDEDEDESSSDDEDVNGGPSDPAKSRKARRQAAAEQLMKALAETVDDDDEMEVDGLNGLSAKKRNKGKGKALSEEDEEDSEDEESEDGADMEEVVVCTLDPQKNYQQPLDLTIGENERAFFKVSGTHAIHLTGNYLIPAESSHDHNHDDLDGDEDEYDLSPDEDDLDEEDESDELDNLEDPRITEVDTEEEEEAPKLIKKDAAPQKGKNKRVAEELEQEPANLDDIMAKSLKKEVATNGEQKLSKKQMKKLKNNAGKAVEAAPEDKNAKSEESPAKDGSTPKGDKKVQFAKNLEQGPTSTAKSPKNEAKTGAKESKAEKKAETKAEPKVNGGTPKTSLGPKTLQGGVKIDDKKLGKGPACKKGNKVGMRYIGKLQDGKVFDANKSGSPFTFTLGTGEVIKGWDIGVAGMSVGGERRIDIPANLAYGSKSLPKIPANSDLRFDVKLLKIN